MDVNKMFKLPALPASAGHKRKFTDAPTPEMLKKFKVEEEPSMAPPPVPTTNGKGKGKATVVSGEEEEARAYAQEDSSANDFEDDEDGRFFGGGLNTEQKQILDIFDQAGDEEEMAAMTLPALRRQLGKFERLVAKNAEQRGKFPDDPSKFIESESDLDSALKQFLPLTQNPASFYPEIVKSGSVVLLTSLLSHENTDIAIDVIEVIQELTDEDVGAIEDDLDDDDEAEGSGGGKAVQVRMAMAEFVDELLNNSVLDLLVANLSRLNEAEEGDSRGVFNILGVFENLLSFMPPLADQVVAETTLMPWLLKRIAVKEYDSNKQYASQVLAILAQQSEENVQKLAELDGMDTLLMVLSQYRVKDPGDGEEVEFMEDVFNILCTILAQPDMKKKFLEAEGVELMVIMMKEKLLARTRAIKVLDYAMQTEDGSDSCERFVDVLGLKTFFSAFMGKGESKKKKLGATSPFEDEEHFLGILVSLFTNLESDTPARIRLIAKFVENDYEKVDRLLEMREVAESRLQALDKEINMERRVMAANQEEVDEDQEAEWYLRRTEAGLSALQNADYVLAWVCMEDDGAMAHAKTLLERKDQSFQQIINVLEDFALNIGDEPEEGENGDIQDEPPLQKVVIGQLVEYLSSTLQ